MSTSPWSAGLIAVADHAPAVLAAVVCLYVVLIAIAAIVGSLHPDQKRRADARKVLERLLLQGRH